MNPGFDKILKNRKALMPDGNSRNVDGPGGGASANGTMAGGPSMENCVQESSIIFCRDPNLLEDA
jgi:hypothetical protein